ncbi:MAG: hypothetical protein DMF84_22790 [Acidobacteria bacterium]|nr:MAG: hypothetical protein DMF84_22790 [Acidobacteriota bacterium]
MFMIAVAAILATERIVRHSLPRRWFILVTLVVFVCLPFANGGFRPARALGNSLWFLPGLYADQDVRSSGPLVAHSLDRMPIIERTFFDQIVDDLCATPPRLLAVEKAEAAPAARRALDLIAYYSQSPRAARLLSAYAPDETLGPFTLYRAVAAACPPQGAAVR